LRNASKICKKKQQGFQVAWEASLEWEEWVDSQVAWEECPVWEVWAVWVEAKETVD
jgi:hypothetical protein